MWLCEVSRRGNFVVLYKDQLPALMPQICGNAIFKAFIHLRDGFSYKVGDGEFSFWFDMWLDVGSVGSQVDVVHISDSELKVQDLWQNSYRNFINLMTMLPECVKHLSTL